MCTCKIQKYTFWKATAVLTGFVPLFLRVFCSFQLSLHGYVLELCKNVGRGTWQYNKWPKKKSNCIFLLHQPSLLSPLKAQLQCWASEELLNQPETVQNTQSWCYLLCSLNSCKHIYAQNRSKGCALRLLFFYTTGSCCFRLPSSIDLPLVCL